MAALPIGAYVASFDALERRRDPLRYFETCGWHQDMVLRECGNAEIYLHAANLAGKTTIGAALNIALAQGREELAGIPLPRLPLPNDGALIVPSYKQSVLSSIKAYRKLIGNWPHHEAMISGSLDYVGVFYIKPIGSRTDDIKQWSKILVFPHDGEIPEGLRLTRFHCDEPAPARILRALRFRRTPGLPFIRLTTATPIDMDLWSYYMQDDEFKHCLGEAKDGRLRIQASIYDNRFLSAYDIAEAERDAKSDPHGEARLFGKHVNVTGKCPFTEELLDRWGQRCQRGRIEEITVQSEEDKPDGRKKIKVVLQVEIWDEPDPHDVYYLVADLSSGVRLRDAETGEENDPAGLHVWSRRHRKLVARFNDWTYSYGVGSLAAILSRRYQNATIDPETNSGWAGPFFTALRDAGCSNVSHETYEDRPGHMATRLGWVNDVDSRGNIIGAVEKSLERDDCTVLSLDVVDCLRHCIIDKKGKILAGSGHHDEDLILTGRALHQIDRRPPPPMREPESNGVSSFEQLIDKEFGRRRPRVEVPVERWR